MRRIGVAFTVVMTLVLSALPAMALTPEPVIVGRGDQYSASSNGTYLAWSNGPSSSAYVMELPSGTRIRVNAAGTGGEHPSFVGTTNLLVYSQRTRRTGDIYFYDVSMGTRTKAPAVVSKAKTWEWAPAASANYLMFMRNKWSRSGELLGRWLLLYDRNTQAVKVLESADGGGLRWFYPNFAGDTYVAWETCGRLGCKIHYWSAAGGELVQPAALDMNQWAATIDEVTNQIYYAQVSQAGCRRATTIRRATLGSSTSTVLASLPRGMMAIDMSLAPNLTTGQQDLYFDRYSCRSETTDIYALRGVDTV